MSNTAPPSCDWIAAPTRLVGLRVSIQWSNSSFYSGKVTRYTPATGMHTIKYDDGEEKSYDMYHKSFRIVSDFKLSILLLVHHAKRRNFEGRKFVSLDP